MNNFYVVLAAVAALIVTMFVCLSVQSEFQDFALPVHKRLICSNRLILGFSIHVAGIKDVVSLSGTLALQVTMFVCQFVHNEFYTFLLLSIPIMMLMLFQCMQYTVFNCNGTYKSF